MKQNDAIETLRHAKENGAHMKPYPKHLSNDEKSILERKAKYLLDDLLSNNLGGYSGVNRPLYILNAFKQVIEDFGYRDVGLQWSLNDLVSHPDHAEAIKRAKKED